MKRGIFIAGFVVSILILQSALVMAQMGKIHIGKLNIIPSATVEVTHDNNIYHGNKINTAKPEEDDWITHARPGLTFMYSFPERGSVSLGYAGDFAFYNDSDDNDWESHQLSFNLDYQAPGGLIFGINNTYTNTEDPYGSLEQYREGYKTKRWNNDLKTTIGYYFAERFKILGYFNFYKQDYDLMRDYGQDYDFNEYGVGFQMRLLPKTWGFISYHFGRRGYEDHPAEAAVIETGSNVAKYDQQRVNVGLTWDSGAKLSGEVNFGYMWKDYDNEFDSRGYRYEDDSTWIADTKVRFRVSPRTNLGLAITRAVRQVYSHTNEHFKDTGIGLNMNHQFLRKFILTMGGVYSENEFNTAYPITVLLPSTPVYPTLSSYMPRKDVNYTANISLDYRIKDWLSAGVGYEYMEKDSNYAICDYTNKQYIISLKGTF